MPLPRELRVQKKLECQGEIYRLGDSFPWQGFLTERKVRQLIRHRVLAIPEITALVKISEPG